MADSGEVRHGSSPNEEFNPLEDDISPSYRVIGHSPDCDADQSSDDFCDHDVNFCNSLEGDLEDLCTAQASEIPFSPPSTSRISKREKIRRNSGKKQQSYKDFKASLAMEKQKPKSVVGIIKERYTESNALFSGLSLVDSDADLDKDNTREGKEKKKKERDEKTKAVTKSRQYDMYMKRHSEDTTSISESITNNTAPMDIQTPIVPVKLEGSGRFLSLGQATKLLPVSPITSEKIERRQIVPSAYGCSDDRLRFYKTFSALINMGSHGKKQKEQKDKDRFFAQRQKSSDEKLYMKYIWVGLQAWLNNRNPNEQEQHLTAARSKVPEMLKELMEFKVQFSANNQVDSRSFNDKYSDSSCDIDTGITETYHTTYLSADIIAQQQEAVIQVQKMLEKLDKCEQLFPTSNAFAQEYILYKDPIFVRRIEALYLWLNTTKELCDKLNVLRQVLNISSCPSAVWPKIDFNNSFDDCDDVRLEATCDMAEKKNDVDDEDNFTTNSFPESEPDSDDGQSGQFGVSKEKDSKRVSFNFSDKRRLSTADISPKRGRSPNNFGSPPDASTPVRAQFSATSLSRASSEVSLDEGGASMYRSYVDKGLKKVGLNKMLIRLRDILYRSLRRARQSLEQPHEDESLVKSPSDELYHPNLSTPSLDLLDKSHSKPLESHKPAELEAWREEFLKIGLPSYRPTYIFLLKVLLEVIHEAMKIRLEQLQNPVGEPSFLSIRQLIIECKDVLAKAVLVKQDYQCMVQAVLDDEEATAENSPLDLEKFDDNMSSMFKMYFQYLQTWLYHLQNLPEASRSLKNPLEEEWSFTKKICPHIIGGEAEAGKRFSTMAISLLNSIADFLESGVDECTTNLFDWTTNDLSDEAEAESEDDHDGSMHRNKSSSSLRIPFQKTCRNFKNLFHEARERASKALGFAKLLRKDLEIAADFNVAVSTHKLLHKLKESNHINVMAPLSAGYLMFIPARIAEQRRHIIQLLNVTCGREDMSMSTDLSIKDEGYLLMVRCGGSASDHINECPVWDGPSIKVEPTAETTIALSHIQVESLLLVVIHSSHLSGQRKEFEQLMGTTVELVNEQTSCHQVIAESLIELKEAAISLREKVAVVIKQVEEHWNCDMEMEVNEKNHILKLYRETMLQAYNFGFEYMKEVTRLVSGETRHKLGPGLMHFAKDWMKFVSEKCERGRGMRPRWANQGLDFLLIACEPKVLAVLSEKEYQELQESLNEFITHLIGNAEKSHGGSQPTTRQTYSRYPSWPSPLMEKQSKFQTQRSPTENINQSHSAPGTATYNCTKRHSAVGLVDLHDGDDGGLVLEVHLKKHRGSEGSSAAGMNSFNYSPQNRIAAAIHKLEDEHNTKLKTQRVIGRVTKLKEVSYHINTRKVNFHWQKGNKIGEGQFGKVYSAVNMDSGELMAMKEMKFPSADLQNHFKEIIDELRIFEGITHPNLVKYYGVEVHRTEMLVFMEYCDRGTIDEVSRVGLSDDLIRIYTKELLKAVQILHDNGIVHRDIKGANIFLTSSGHLKLGDFGCSVKLKNHTTMAGEVNSLVGTTAYMAPEVITRNDKEGHGRAADIWSVGCVVIEMATGKRPWYELESHYQIMFKLGMGEAPPIPEKLGEEGKDFLSHCLTQDPNQRWTASQLRDHQFVKIYDPERDDVDDSQG